MENLNEQLEELPVFIASQAVKVEEARMALDKSKHALEIAEATEFLNVKGETKKTVKEIDSQVALNTEMQAIEVIKAEGRYKSEIIALEKLANQFASVRKMVNLKISEMSALNPNL